MRFKIFLFALGATFLLACGGDDIDCEDASVVNGVVTVAFQDVNAAINTWNDSEQTEDDCKTLKSAYEDFIELLGDAGECGVDVATDIQQAQNSVSGLPCG